MIGAGWLSWLQEVLVGRRRGRVIKVRAEGWVDEDWYMELQVSRGPWQLEAP